MTTDTSPEAVERLALWLERYADCNRATDDTIFFDVTHCLRVQSTALTESQAENARLREALQRIVEWSDAYPTKVFPEPDFKRAAAALSTAGMSLDAISASNMRHAVAGAGDIARAALQEGRK